MKKPRIKKGSLCRIWNNSINNIYIFQNVRTSYSEVLDQYQYNEDYIKFNIEESLFIYKGSRSVKIDHNLNIKCLDFYWVSRNKHVSTRESCLKGVIEVIE